LTSGLASQAAIEPLFNRIKNHFVDFLKLVQQKEQKIDNKIIIIVVFLLLVLISLIMFWPKDAKHNLLAYLPKNVSFYYHITDKKNISQPFFPQEIVQDRISELEDVLGNNFLNLQEIVWFQVDGSLDTNNYLLQFSRLPKSTIDDLATNYPNYIFYSPRKNVLLITQEELPVFVEASQEKEQYFFDGLSIYWKKNESPQFLDSLADVLEPIFVGDEVLLNWHAISKTKHGLRFVENRVLRHKDIGGFLIPKNFDLAVAFTSDISDSLAKDITDNLLRTLFNSLPYYNLSTEVIKNKILSDSILWQRGEDWILASDSDWRDSILDFIKTIKTKEVSKVLADGTAYKELVAADDQAIVDYQINGQTVSQIDQLFIWDIDQEHYLSNSRQLIEELTSYNRYLNTLANDCLGDDVSIGDFVYLDTQNIVDSPVRQYLLDNNINNLQMFSYTTGTISGLDVCF